MAASVVETSRAKIRSPWMWLPSHLGNGWFGGLLPLICPAIYASTKSIYLPLLYPGAVVVVSLIVGGLFLRESSHVRIWDEVDELRPGMGEPQPAGLAG